MKDAYSRPFQRQQRTTAISNDVLDYVMPHLSGNAWKVLSFIIRKTDGWKKEADKIAYSQISSGCGITNTTIKRALDELQGLKTNKKMQDFGVDLNLIIAHKGKRGLGGHLQTTLYQINREFTITSKMKQATRSKADIALAEELETLRRIEDGET